MKYFLQGGSDDSADSSDNTDTSNSSSNFTYIIIGIVILLIIISIIAYFIISSNAAKEKADKEAKEKADKEAKEKADKEAKEKADKEAKEKAALVSKVRIEINEGKANYLQISQLVVLDSNNNIIKPIQINATEPTWSPESNKDVANDGTRDPRPYPQIYHNAQGTETTSFYEFVIPPSKIKTIEIYNRTDCCTERIEDFSLYLINSNNNTLNTFRLTNLPKQIFNIN
jgi:Na+-transporting methylmalonyl-CoA/oxaloacetate decarboxylase gamma subunit